jgi:hypothetical protein
LIGQLQVKDFPVNGIGYGLGAHAASVLFSASSRSATLRKFQQIALIASSVITKNPTSTAVITDDAPLSIVASEAISLIVVSFIWLSFGFGFVLLPSRLNGFYQVGFCFLGFAVLQAVKDFLDGILSELGDIGFVAFPLIAGYIFRVVISRISGVA